MVTERKVIGKIEILENGVIQVRDDTVIERDGIEISRLFHRRILEPDIVSNETDARLTRVINATWTPEVITEFKRKRQEARDRERLRG